MINFFMAFLRLGKVKVILTTLYLVLNGVNEPKDFAKVITIIQTIQSILEKVLVIIGVDLEDLKEDVTVTQFIGLDDKIRRLQILDKDAEQML